MTVIDFPQMVSTSHMNANFYFQRDLQGILAYFSKNFNYEDPTVVLPEIKSVRL